MDKQTGIHMIEISWAILALIIVFLVTFDLFTIYRVWSLERRALMLTARCLATNGAWCNSDHLNTAQTLFFPHQLNQIPSQLKTAAEQVALLTMRAEISSAKLNCQAEHGCLKLLINSKQDEVDLLLQTEIKTLFLGFLTGDSLLSISRTLNFPRETAIY